MLLPGHCHFNVTFMKRSMGADFFLPQLSIKGGPKTGVYIEYSSLNMEIVEVQNATGKLSAKALGNSVSQSENISS